MRCMSGLLKPTGDVGQQANHNRRDGSGQLLRIDLNKKSGG